MSTSACVAYPPAESEARISIHDNLPALGKPVWLFEPGQEPWIGGRGEDSGEWFWGNCCDSLYMDENGAWACSGLSIDDDYQPTHWANIPAPAPSAAR